MYEMVHILALVIIQTNSRPVPNLTFSKKVGKGGSNICVMVHILALVITQTKKLYISDTNRCRPFTNGCQLGWVHADLAMANYMAQVIRPHSEEMHISSSLHIAGECEGGSGWNGGGVSAPRGYYYT